jgi:hypothetical protein
MPLRDGAGFLAFDALVATCCPGDSITDARLRQILAAKTLGDYMKVWKGSVDRHEPPPGADGSDVTTQFGTFRPSRGAFSPSWRAVLGGLGMGLLACGASVAAALLPASIRRTGKFVAVIGTASSDVSRDGSDERFVEFCRKGPISTLHAPAMLMVQHGDEMQSGTDSGILYAKRPLYRLMRTSHAGWRRRLGVAGRLLIGATEVLVKTPFEPRRALLLRDRMEAVGVRALVRWGSLGEVMFTNSAATRQATWVRDGSVRCSMAWYSENSKWIWQDGNHAAELPMYRHLAIGEHWVWTAAHRDWLHQLGHRGPCHVVGPILWYLPRTPLARSPSNPAWITVFDIVPVSDRRGIEIGFVDNYYSAARCSEFLRRIVAAVESARLATGQDLRIRIKPKRIQPLMAPEYAAELDALVRSGIMTVMDSAQDLFDVVRESSLSVVQPFSSPALVAAHTGARACYFDAGGVLERPADLDPAIFFAQDQAALGAIILDAVRSTPHYHHLTSP